jgi:hypothetical protein
VNPNFLIWFVGNLVLPAVPVASVWIAQAVAKKAPNAQSVLKDGVLFFYVVGVAALLVMDLWKDQISAGDPKVSAGAATALLSTCLLVMIFAGGAYFVMALAHTGTLDKDGDPFDLRPLAHLSWRSALVAAISASTARGLTGIF